MKSTDVNSGKWGDFLPRLISAIVMVVVGAAALWAGGLWFNALILIIVGLMLWELVRMGAPEKPAAAVQSGLLGAGALAALLVLPAVFLAPVLVAAILVVAGASDAPKRWIVPFTAAILLAGLSLIHLRGTGIPLVLIVIGIVVVTDIAGYIAGRIFGGPKFWPRFSPKKTWSGTVAGWIGAAVIAAWVASQYGLPLWLAIGGGVLMSLASQMGDIAESAFKRKTGVKDSSNLIPGHGGVMDRFDGMLAAALLAGVLMLLISLAAAANV